MLVHICLCEMPSVYCDCLPLKLFFSYASMIEERSSVYLRLLLYLSINLYHMRHTIHSRTSFFRHFNQFLKFLFICVIAFSSYFKVNTFGYWLISYIKSLGKVNDTFSIDLKF